MDIRQVYVELWVSLASLLRSYTAAHGLNGNRQATVELGEELITVRHGEKWLALKRSGAEIAWRREDGSTGSLKLGEDGSLMDEKLEAPEGRMEMDLKAEEWARELMR